MRILTIFLLVVGPLGSVQADTYRWQDRQGNVHYGDRPPAGAEGLRLVKTFECKTEQCEADWQRYYDEAIAVNDSIDEWLREIDVMRQQQDGLMKRSSISYVQTIVAPYFVPVQVPLIAEPYTPFRRTRAHPRPDLYVKERLRHTRSSYRR